MSEHDDLQSRVDQLERENVQIILKLEHAIKQSNAKTVDGVPRDVLLLLFRARTSLGVADAELTRLRTELAESRRRCGVAGEALRFELGSLIKYTDCSTHYEGCDKNHRACAAIKRLRAALAELERGKA